MKHLPIGIQTFRQIIENNYLYVDKTQLIYELVKLPKGVFFLARPRRFGKSLLISTLKELFSGSRELFRDQWIAKTDYSWESFPIIHIDFGEGKPETASQLKDFLQRKLGDIAHSYGIELRHGEYYQQFADLIRALGKRNPVVILIDEYDKPIIDYIEKPELAIEMREVLRGFYSVIKATDADIRFVFLTGVSKFSKAGIFSGLNQLQDISISSQYGALLGITQAELESCFSEHLELLGRETGHPNLLEQIKLWYNGFCFSRKLELVYNPVSLLLLFSHLEFRNYWFESATPRFLLALLRKNHFDLTKLANLRVREDDFLTFEVEQLSIVALLYQTGYLSIKAYDPEFMLFTLGYPNFEVENSFQYGLLQTYNSASTEGDIVNLVQALRANDFELFFNVLRVFFSQIPDDIHIEQEKYYQTVFFLIFKLIGLKIQAEVRTNKGRVDAVIIDKAVYIFEFKFSGKAETALLQIKKREYFEQYKNLNKRLHLIGVEFSHRNIGKWLVESVSSE